MNVRKIRADRIFDGCSWWPEGSTLVLSEKGVVIEITTDPEPGAEVWKGVLCPGFVNAHCHLELSHMKGRVPEGTGMTDFLLHVMFNRQSDAGLVQYCMQSAVEEMTGNGIVAVGDICNTTDSLTIKHSSGLQWHHFIEVTGFVPGAAKMRFDMAIQTTETFSRLMGAGRVSVVPHAAYSVSPALFELLQNQEQRVVCMHNQESQAEEDFIGRKQGDLLRLFEAIGVNIDFFEPQQVSSLQYTAQYLPVAPSVILVHNCHTRSADVHYLFDTYALLKDRFHFCLCPNANRYIGNPLPDVPMLLEHTAHICIGTDSLASNRQLSILSELAALQEAYPGLDPSQMLQWATQNGAVALQMADTLGSFTRGKKPGVLLLEGLDEGMNFARAHVQRLV
jgi:cytosine/adenosine deaminase-related metal-dependent hydrolase